MKCLSRLIKSSRVVEEKYISRDNQLDLIKLNEIEAKKIISEALKKSDDIINEANVKANEILEEANLKAEKVLEITYNKVQEINEKAKSEGYNAGFDKGYLEGRKQSEILIEEAINIKKDFLNERKKILDSIENDVIDLVIQTIEKVINDKLNDKETIIKIINNGLKKIDNSKILKIVISEEDYEIVKAKKNSILSYSSYIEDIEIKIDPNFKRGDVVIETSKGNIDTSVTTQIEKIKNIFKELLGRE